MCEVFQKRRCQTYIIATVVIRPIMKCLQLRRVWLPCEDVVFCCVSKRIGRSWPSRGITYWLLSFGSAGRSFDYSREEQGLQSHLRPVVVALFRSSYVGYSSILNPLRFVLLVCRFFHSDTLSRLNYFVLVIHPSLRS